MQQQQIENHFLFILFKNNQWVIEILIENDDTTNDSFLFNVVE